MKHFSQQLNHYLPLLGIICATIVGFILFPTDKSFKEVIMIASAAAYVSWGIVHHMHHKDLTLMILVEYMAVALLGVVIVFSVLFRS